MKQRPSLMDAHFHWNSRMTEMKLYWYLVQPEVMVHMEPIYTNGLRKHYTVSIGIKSTML